jgi:hypothetical protein
MPRNKISEYSATAAENTDNGGIDIAEGCAPSGINNAIRTLMSDLKDWQAGTSADLLPIAAGGTGAASASAARTSLGLVIGTNVQAHDTNLTSFVNTFTLPTTDGSANQFLKTDGSGTIGFATISVLDSPLSVIGNSTAGAEIRLPEDTDNGTNYVAIKAPDAITTNATLLAPTNQSSATLGYLNIPQSGSEKTASYTLATTDVGQLISVGASGSITVPNSVFSAGDAILIFNNTASSVTLTMSITTAYIGGTNADYNTLTLGTRGIANILFISGTVCVVTGNVS